MASIHTTKKSPHPVTREPGNACVSHYRSTVLFRNDSAPAERRWHSSTDSQGTRMFAPTRAALLTQIDTLIDNPKDHP